MIYAAILAGGSGSRMGKTDKPKQFLEFGGRPVIVHTIETFLRCREIDRVIVMTPAEWCEYTCEMLTEYFTDTPVRYATVMSSEKAVSEICKKAESHYEGDTDKKDTKGMDGQCTQVSADADSGGMDGQCMQVSADADSGGMDRQCTQVSADADNGGMTGQCTQVSADADSGGMDGQCMQVVVAAGGSTRNETLMNAIAVIEAEDNLDDDTVIVTHDAVRPFASKRMISENIDAAMRTGACETAFPATDTIVETDDGRMVTDVPDRSRLWMVQTPQTFRAKRLRELYKSLTDEERAVLTDAARIYVMKGEPVEIVRGESWNIKITYAGDLGVAEAIYDREVRRHK